MHLNRLAILLPAALGLAACDELAMKAPPAPAPATTGVVQSTGTASVPVAVTPAVVTTTAPGTPVVAAVPGAPVVAGVPVVAPAPGAAAGRLGSAILSLGAATEPGLWIKTPLVKARTNGRIVDTASGKSAAVVLLPLTGGSGAQASIGAMQAIGAGLTDLPEVDIFAA